MLVQLQAFDDALASSSQLNHNQNNNDDLYSDVNTSEDEMDDFNAGDHAIYPTQTRQDDPNHMHRDNISKTFTTRL